MENISRVGNRNAELSVVDCGGCLGTSYRIIDSVVFRSNNTNGFKILFDIRRSTSLHIIDSGLSLSILDLLLIFCAQDDVVGGAHVHLLFE